MVQSRYDIRAMNIHPALVHFPIALLTLYSLFELIPSRRVRHNSTWQKIKAVFLLLGSASSLLTYQAGLIAKELFGETDLINMHQLWATITVWFFAFLSLVYLLALFKERIMTHSGIIGKFSGLARAATWLYRSPLLMAFGLFGLAAITITGALGGAIVYGPNNDPAVQFIYSLFF